MERLLHENQPKADKKLVQPKKFPKIISTNQKKIRRELKKRNSETKYAVYTLGDSYRSALSSSVRGNGSIDKRIVVRGHHRDQWYGSRTDERGNPRAGDKIVSIWIEPFVKGDHLPKGKTDVYNVIKE